MPANIRLLEIDTQTRLEAGATQIKADNQEEEEAVVGGVSLDEGEFIYIGGDSLPIAQAVRAGQFKADSTVVSCRSMVSIFEVLRPSNSMMELDNYDSLVAWLFLRMPWSSIRFAESGGIEQLDWKQLRKTHRRTVVWKLLLLDHLQVERVVACLSMLL